MQPLQLIPWIFASFLAIERMIHYRTRSRGSHWFSAAFLLCAAAATFILIASPPQFAVRIVLGLTTILTATAGGLYAHAIADRATSNEKSNLVNHP